MEAQLHRTHDRDYDDQDHLNPAGTDLHGEERGEETRSTMKKVKEKVDKLKATIKHGHGHGHHGGGEHKDEAQAVNDSPVVKIGLVEPTVMGTPVLAEDLYTTHSDILDPPVRSFAQWEDEDRHGAPPPLSTAYQTHLTDLPHHVGHPSYGQDVNKEQFEAGIWKPPVLDEEEMHGAPPPSLMSTGYETHLTDPPHVDHGDTYGQDLNREQLNTGEKEVGITGVLKSLGKMKVFDEPHTKSSESDQNDQNEPKDYAGSHDQFAPEPVENPPLDTIAENPSHPNSSYTQRISSVTSSIAGKATSVKDSIVSKLSPVSHKTNTRSSFPTDFSHKVADTLSSTLGPVYETVAEAGSSVMSKMQGAGPDDTNGGPATKTVPEGRGVTVKEYLVDTFKPGDDDKVLSEVITHAFHRGKGNQSPDEASMTTYVVRDEGERRLED